MYCQRSTILLSLDLADEIVVIIKFVVLLEILALIKGR